MRYVVFSLALAISGAAHAEEVIQVFEGKDAHTTRPFTTEGSWEIQWDAKGDIFQLFLFSSNGDMLGLPANQMGSGTGSAFQPHAGSFYLQMNAIGSWTVSIVSLD